jgi:serine/threonine protein kinase
MPYVADEFTGRTIGKYELLCRLAVGGMAEIFLGFSKTGPSAWKPVVLKRILTEHRDDDQQLQMLIDEAKITATMNHPNVAQVLDLEIAGDEVLLVIEFIRGATLDEIVHLVTEKKEVVPLGFVLSAIRDCAQGLHHAHSHKDVNGNLLPIIHRDVTPKNLMVDFDGVGKVLDFGIARAMGAARRTVAGMVRGTSAYMSPEQAVDGKMDIRTDIFSLGTIFHELLTGQRLFHRGNAGKEMAAVYESEVPAPSTLNRRVPKALDAVVLKALERTLPRRYQTALELVRDLSLAASSTAWPAERCAELVRNRFASRRDEIFKLIELMSSRDEASGSSTAPGRPAFSSLHKIEATQIVGPPRSPAQTATVQVTPNAQNDNTDEQAARSGGASVDEEGQMPTSFFTPDFNQTRISARALPPVARSSDGPIPQLDSSDDGSINTADRTSPGPLTPLAKVSAMSPETGTEPGTRRRVTRSRGTSRLGVVLAAIAALAVGVIGGVAINRYLGLAVPAQSQGLGRLSLDTDRSAEVQLGDNITRTPVVDVWMAPGKHQFKLREPNGVWLALEVDVKPDKPTKVKVSLDSLHPVP